MVSGLWVQVSRRRMEGAYGMKGFGVSDVFNRDPLHNLIFTVVLAYASNRDAQAIVERAVLDADVGAVSL